MFHIAHHSHQSDRYIDTRNCHRSVDTFHHSSKGCFDTRLGLRTARPSTLPSTRNGSRCPLAHSYLGSSTAEKHKDHLARANRNTTEQHRHTTRAILTVFASLASVRGRAHTAETAKVVRHASPAIQTRVRCTCIFCTRAQHSKQCTRRVYVLISHRGPLKPLGHTH